MTQGNVEFYFFFHDDESRRVLDEVRKSSAVTIVDLRAQPLPQEWLDHGVEREILGGSLSEYLGHINIDPRSQLVGVFTYSVFRKFTRVWALRAGDRARFLPEVTPRVILEAEYSPYCLSHLEMQRGEAIWEFLKDYPEIQERLSAMFGDPAQLPRRFPLKGGFVISFDRFVEYRSWLRETIPIVLKEFGRFQVDGVNAYSRMKGFPEEHRRRQNTRFLIGGILERLAGVFVARQHKRLPRWRIGAPVEGDDTTSPLAVAQKAEDGRGNIVLVFADSSYRAILDNWLVAIARLPHVPFFVCALDRELYSQLKREGVPVVHTPRRASEAGWRPRASLWALRVETVAELVAQGFNVLLSDIDAVWLRDPLPYLAGLEGSIVASQGTGWPENAFNAWKFVLCCGFIQFRSDAFSLSVLERMKQDSTENPGEYDDQTSLNQVLLESNVRWDIDDRYTLQQDDHTLLCSRDPIVGSVSAKAESDPMGRVILIPHCVVQRLPNEIEDPSGVLVKHPRSKRSAEAVISALAANDLWFIPDLPS